MVSSYTLLSPNRDMHALSLSNRHSWFGAQLKQLPAEWQSLESSLTTSLLWKPSLLTSDPTWPPFILHGHQTRDGWTSYQQAPYCSWWPSSRRRSTFCRGKSRPAWSADLSAKGSRKLFSPLCTFDLICAEAPKAPTRRDLSRADNQLLW